MGLACSGKEIYHFCFVLLCIRGQIPSTSPPGGLYSEGRFNGGFFALRFWGAYIWKGLFSEFYGTLSSGSSLVKGRTCARDPVQQHFICVSYGISTEALAWHIGKEHTNLMNSRTPTITHFAEHSTRLYNCKS